MKLRLLGAELRQRSSRTRLPFRYGAACLVACPQAIVAATVEVDGHRITGYSGDCLPPLWFDKRPNQSFEQQIQAMVDVAETAASVFADRFRQACGFFPAWLDSYREIQRLARQQQLPGLLASFGASLLERAMIDAAARATHQSFHQLIHANALEIDFGQLDDSLRDRSVAQWLPARPRAAVFVRHTVGLGDPLSEADLVPDAMLHDGLPQSLEAYLQRRGLRYLKVKVSNQLEADLARLEKIAALLAQYRGHDYQLTLDGNEQYQSADEFATLIDAIRSRSQLAVLWRNVILIEQPLHRDIALSPEHTQGVRDLAAEKPVIIDESDADLESFVHAMDVGYRGVSSKSCKGPIKSLLNAGRCWVRNQTAARGTSDSPSYDAGGDTAGAYVMSGEDLCSVGIVPLQSDLCLVATLGLSHVERNGHHYHPGLSYLPTAQQQAARQAHPDLYTESYGIVQPRLADGQFRIASLQCPGLGFAVIPDFDAMSASECGLSEE